MLMTSGRPHQFSRIPALQGRMNLPERYQWGKSFHVPNKVATIEHTTTLTSIYLIKNCTKHFWHKETARYVNALAFHSRTFKKNWTSGGSSYMDLRLKLKKGPGNRVIWGYLGSIWGLTCIVQCCVLLVCAIVYLTFVPSSLHLYMSVTFPNLRTIWKSLWVFQHRSFNTLEIMKSTNAIQ